LARKTPYINIIQMDARMIAVLRCKMAGKKAVEVSWLCQKGDWPDADALAEAFRSFIHEHRLQDDTAYLLLPRYDVTTRFLTLPSHDRAEIAGMVRFSAEEYVPYALDEMVIDQCILNPLESGESHVLAALAHLDVVNRQITTFSKAGLSPERVLLSTACLAAVVSAGGNTGDFALVNLNAGGIEITVFERGVPVFSRGIVTARDWGAIAENPDFSEGPGVLDASGAEELASEVRGSLAAYRRESAEGLGTDEVYVACGYARVEKLCASLSEKTGKHCVPADFALSLLDGGGATLPGIPADFIGALQEISGAVPSSLNLLPVKETEARRIKGVKRLTLRAFLFVMVILLALCGLYFQGLYQRTRFVRELQARIAQIEPNAQGIKEKREALNILRRQVDRKGSIIEQIARIVESAPEGQINFSRISLHRSEGISLWGRAKAVNDVARFTQNIRSNAESHLAFFARARSLYEQQTLERDVPVYSYQIEVSMLEDEDDS